MAKSKEEHRAQYLKTAYNLTLAQERKMDFDQKGLCKICLRAPAKGGRPLMIDHDHKTGRVRGKLCFRCNHRLLGRGLENAWLHQQAALYLLSDFDARLL